MRRHTCIGVMLLVAWVRAASGAEVAPPGEGWTKPVNGVQGRVVLKRAAKSNGTVIIEPYLELRNSGAAKQFAWSTAAMTLTVMDGEGMEFPRMRVGAFDGGSLSPVDLMLPQQSEMSFRLGSGGWGIPADKPGMIDMGIKDAWLFEQAGAYFFKVTLEIADKGIKGRADVDRLESWSGKLDFPAVAVPLKAPVEDAAALGKRIDVLGARVVSGDGRIAEPAMRDLSLIDDPRVVSWWVKAVDTGRYELQFNALDRLSRFGGDEALGGMKIGMAAKDDNIRHSAAIALSKSPHPEAIKQLMTMAHDPYHGVRLTVMQTMDRVNTPEAVALIRSMLNDPNEMVAGEAARYMKMREGAATRGN